MSVGTAFHSRTAPLNRKLEWREWSGYYAAGMYADHIDIEYNAIREAVALIDVSPLYKYRVSGPDAAKLVDRIITRDAGKIPERGVIYTCWCDERGKVLDDGTVHRLDDGSFRWTAADPSLRWFRMNGRGLDAEVSEISEEIAALAIQGPRSRALLSEATGESWDDLRYFRRRPARIGDVEIDVSRTGYTGDLGYELWIPAERAEKVWDAVAKAGVSYGARPAGMLALDVVRIEAGLILIEADFFSARHALTAEQAFSPYEIGLGRLVNFNKGNFVGRRALEREQARGRRGRRLAGIEIGWAGIAEVHASHGLPPAVPAVASRAPIPLYAGSRQVGRATSTTWSPALKKMIGLASVRAQHTTVGTRLRAEWSVEGRRHKVLATVTELPFFDPPRKKD